MLLNGLNMFIIKSLWPLAASMILRLIGKHCSIVVNRYLLMGRIENLYQFLLLAGAWQRPQEADTTSPTWHNMWSLNPDTAVYMCKATAVVHCLWSWDGRYQTPTLHAIRLAASKQLKASCTSWWVITGCIQNSEIIRFLLEVGVWSKVVHCHVKSLCCVMLNPRVECIVGFASKVMNSSCCHIFDSQDIEIIILMYDFNL